jgi:cytosine/adenosine deaminase-related metal-dependent hydrolase
MSRIISLRRDIIIGDKIAKIDNFIKPSDNETIINAKGMLVLPGSSRDMIRKARTGAYLQKAVTLNPSAVELSTSYKMLTQNGAKAHGNEDLKTGILNSLLKKAGYK